MIASRVQAMTMAHVPGAVALQRACFPPPFPEELLWRDEHLERHLELFPEGQFIATDSDGHVVGSASACRISNDAWNAHRPWDQTVGGPFIENHDRHGPVLYGLDVSVHPEWRGRGVGRTLYQARFSLVRALGLERYGTACRMPGYLDWAAGDPSRTPDRYAEAVVLRNVQDRTFTPLLRYGLTFLQVLHDYMDDEESGNAAALLEWIP